MRSGDLGCLIDDELYVVGRLKDLIIIRGRNLYPQDIENISETSHPSCLLNSCAAFTLSDENELEQLIVVQEVKRKSSNPKEIGRIIRQSIWEEFEIQPAAVVLVSPGAIPKTSSGKTQRNLCKSLFVSGQLKTLETNFSREKSAGSAKTFDNISDLHERADFEKSDAVIAAVLKEIVVNLFGVEPEDISFSDPLTSYGLDSLKTVNLIYEIQKHFQTVINIGDILSEPTIDYLTSLISRSLREEIENNSDDEIGKTKFDRTALSYGQKSLFFLHQIAPQSAAYNISRALRIKNEIDQAVLKKSLSALIERHPLLKSFYVFDGKPQRKYAVDDQQALEYSVVNVEDLSFAEIKNLLQNEANRPFDLESGALLRVSLFRRNSNEHYLLISLHHIICDLWSLEIFFRELDILYAAYSIDEYPQLAHIPLQYENYCERLENSLTGKQGEEKLNYWIKTLEGDLPVVDLPADFSRPNTRKFSGRKLEFDINKADISHLKNICEEAGTTLFVGLLALYGIFIYRYTGQDSFFVGCPVAGRGDLRTHNVVGYFVNTLPVKIQIQKNETFRDLIEQIKVSFTAALKNEYPFSVLVEKMGLVRDSGHLPVFQVMLVMLNSFANSAETLPLVIGRKGGQLNLSFGQAEPIGLDHHGAQSDLSLLLADSGETVLAAFEYDEELFKESTVTAFSQSILSILAELASNPERLLSDYDFLVAEEKRKILVEWNETGKNYPDDLLFHKLITRRSRQSPDTVALKFGAKEMTYAELDELSNAFAFKLIESGVKPDEIVAVTLDRCLELLPVILGIIKSGAAYLPLDKGYPQERLLHIIEEANCKIVVGDADSDLTSSPDFNFLDIGKLWNRLAQEKTPASPQITIDEDNLAYVIYTSGSTGNPKGVMISHKGIYNRLLWMQDTYRVNSQDKILLKTSLTFDVSVWELFLPLISGATLVIAPPDIHREAAALLRIIEEEKITILHFVPSVLRAVLNLNGKWSETLRLVVCSGESLSADIVEEFKSQCSSGLHNLYGPTEASVDVTYWNCLQNTGGQNIPIGRPIANTQIFILDEFSRSCSRRRGRRSLSGRQRRCPRLFETTGVDRAEISPESLQPNARRENLSNRRPRPL